MALSSDFQKLEVDGLISLYELDASKFGIGFLRFHGLTAYRNGEEWRPNIIWQGQVYEPISIEAKGMEMRSDGRASAPTLTIANNINGIQGAISAYCLQHGDFAGAKLKVITTLAKYLDAENFPEGNPTASNESKEQHWYIEQKISENPMQVVFELSNPIDFEGWRIPARQITSLCEWACKGRYRGEECGYIGTKMFTDKNEPTTDAALDRCAGQIRSCKLRHGENAPLPFGGFPAANLM